MSQIVYLRFNQTQIVTFFIGQVALVQVLLREDILKRKSKSDMKKQSASLQSYYFSKIYPKRRDEITQLFVYYTINRNESIQFNNNQIQMALAALLAIAQQLAAGMWGLIPQIDRRVACGIASDADFHLDGVVLYSGKEHKVPPNGNYKELGMGFSKTTGTATGTAGVIHLTVKGTPMTLMWSVPYDYNLYENWFGVNEGHRTFDDMYYNLKPSPGGTQIERQFNGFTIGARLGNGGEADFLVAILQN